jgi:hypothetical protein
LRDHAGLTEYFKRIHRAQINIGGSRKQFRPEWQDKSGNLAAEARRLWQDFGFPSRPLRLRGKNSGGFYSGFAEDRCAWKRRFFTGLAVILDPFFLHKSFCYVSMTA